MRSNNIVTITFIAVIIGISMLCFKPSVAYAGAVADVGVSYTGHVENIGWQNPVGDGEEIGTDGKGLRVEALKLSLTNVPVGASIQYETHVQNIGWQAWVADGQEAGTDGKGLRVEALKIKLKNMPGYSVQYRAHVQNIGWQEWVADGQEIGTDGKGLRIEALEVKISKISNNSTIGISYSGHVQNVGWQDTVENGQISGTEGKSLRVEAIKLNLVNAPAGAKIDYQTHVQNIGWQTPTSNGLEAGTDGKGLRVEALKIRLENMPGYSVQYRVHVQSIGWQDWVHDGLEAGTDGKGLKIEALEVRIVKTADGSTPISEEFSPVTSLKFTWAKVRDAVLNADFKSSLLTETFSPNGTPDIGITYNSNNGVGTDNDVFYISDVSHSDYPSMDIELTTIGSDSTDSNVINGINHAYSVLSKAIFGGQGTEIANIINDVPVRPLTKNGSTIYLPKVTFIGERRVFATQYGSFISVFISADNDDTDIWQTVRSLTGADRAGVSNNELKQYIPELSKY
ncbi:clostridial hydrophobic W [Clostridium acetobutylicum]|nr:chromophore lyase [Clostridium acetobutylicum]OOM08188.1 clostridial hydrophobic W [Clostridium acetobutylicum]